MGGKITKKPRKCRAFYERNFREAKGARTLDPQNHNLML